MDKPTKFKLFLGTSIFLFSLFAWWALKDSMYDGGNWVFKILFPSLLFLILGSVMGLAFLVEKERRLLTVAPLLALLPFCFFAQWTLGTLVFGILAALFMFLAVLRIHSHRENRIKLEIYSIIYTGLSSTLTGLALLATLIFYWSPYAQSLQGTEIEIPRPFFDAVAGPAVNLVIKPGLPAGLNVAQIERLLSDAQDQAYNGLNQMLAVQGRAYKKLVPAGLAASFFFAVKIWGTILSGFMMMLSWLAYKILLSLGIVKITETDVKKEEIEINA